MNQERSGDDAERGTRLHDAVAKVLSGKLSYAELPAEAEAVQFCAQYVRDNIPQPWQIEQRVELLDDDFEPVYFGTADLHHYSPEHGLWLVDFKSFHVRDCLEQMCAYALPLMDMYGEPQCMVRVVYGMAKHVSEMLITRDYSMIKVREIIGDRTDPDRQPKACDWCGYCANRLTCLAVQGVAEKIVGEYDKAVAIRQWHPSKVQEPETIAYFMDLARTAQTWIDSVKNRAAEMFRQGVPVPGYKQQSRRLVEVTDIQAAFERSGVGDADFLRCCKVNIGPLSEVIAARDGMSKDKARKALEAALGDALTVKESVSIVRERGSKTKEIVDAATED